MDKNNFLIKKAKETRLEIFKFKTKSGLGHLATCLSCVDICTSIYYDSDFDAYQDYLIFSKGHGSPAIYPILADLNFFDKEELAKYCQEDGILRLHSDWSIPGCHFVGGSLGNGLGFASGLAMAQTEKKVVVILGDAELYEGSIWESLMFINHYNLKNMTLVVDRNKFGILGNTEEMIKLEPLDQKFSAFGFDVISVDGHNFDELRSAFSKESDKPKLIIANTIKGKGVSYMEDKYEYHTIIPKKVEDIEKGLEELS
jgi:transketolase